MSAPTVPACGMVGCQDLDKKHRHLTFEVGMRVVAEPKRPGAPGWAYSQPHGTVTGEAFNHFVDVTFDDGRVESVAVDLLTKYHTWRRRKAPTAAPKLLPRLPRTHRITAENVEEPFLFGDAS